ncbi:hypothetical protein JCM6882_005647 [Rhodosporidiobolus microsporus]
MTSFSPLDLFPPTASTSRAPLAVPASSIALFGPLPTSSLIHLALNHLRGEGGQTARTEGISEKARGKQREVDDEESFHDDEDDFPPPPRSTGKERRVLILTPDASVLREELSKEGDVSLFGSRRSSETARLLDLVDIRTLPTFAHLTYFLSTCYTPSTPSAQDAHAAFLATKPRTWVDPSYLPYDPTMVIFHAPSDYLEEPANEDAGLEAYGSLLGLFVSTFLSLTFPTPFLVLFDPLASAHSLPGLPRHLHPTKQKKRPFEGEEGERDEGRQEGEDDSDRVPLRRIAERFFDWVGEAQEVFSSGKDYNAPSRAHYVLSLEASPFSLSRSALQQDKVEVEFAVVEVGDNDAEGEEGGVRIEVVR